MPPILAFCLCLTAVGYLLVIDRKQAPKVSMYLWLPTLWMLYCGSRPLGNWFGDGAGSGHDVEDGSAIDRLALSLLMVLAAIVLKRRNFSLGQAFRQQRWLILLYAFALLSCAWSDHPYVAFKRWVRVFGSLLMVWVVLTENLTMESVETIFRRYAYILLPFSMLLIKYYPDMGVQYDAWEGTTMWIGVTTQKNSLGSLSLVAAFFFIWVLHRRWRRGELWSARLPMLADVSILFLALWILKGPGVAYSATAAVALIIGSLLYAFSVRFSHRAGGGFNLVSWIAIPGIIVGISLPLAGGAGILSGILDILGRDTTFTGRTEIWSGILPTAWEHSILGVGYGSYWINPPLRFPLNMLTHAHNGYLNIFVELGCLGLALLVAFLLSVFKMAQKALTWEVEWAAFAAGLLLILLFHNVTECSFLRASSSLWTVALLLAALLPHLCVEPCGSTDSELSPGGEEDRRPQSLPQYGIESPETSTWLQNPESHRRSGIDAAPHQMSQQRIPHLLDSPK
jgi:exopolysaccharide production protein ExoQ